MTAKRNSEEAVKRRVRAGRLLLAGKATEANVVAAIDAAPAIHFAGHADQRAGAARLLLPCAT